LFCQRVQSLANLPFLFPILAQIVNQPNVRLAAAANNRFLMTHLPEKWTHIKIAPGALKVDMFAVEIHSV